MGPFLAGFCSELTKTAFADPPPTPVPATGAPTTQRPTGAAAAPPRPSQSAQGPRQYTYEHAPKQEQWRPSPKYTPKPGPAEPAKKKSSGGGGKKLPDRMPWSTEVRRAPGQAGPAPMSKPPVAKVAPGQRMGVTSSTTNKDLMESGAMPKSVYDKLDPREQTSSHVPEHGPYSRKKRTSVTAKEWTDPNDYNPHTGQMTPRAQYEADNPRQFGLRGNSKPRGGLPTFGSGKQSPMNAADSAQVAKWMKSQDQIKIGPQENSWGQDDTWQNRGAVNQFATVKDLTPQENRPVGRYTPTRLPDDEK